MQVIVKNDIVINSWRFIKGEVYDIDPWEAGWLRITTQTMLYRSSDHGQIEELKFDRNLKEGNFIKI